MSNFWAKVCGIFCVAVAAALLALLGITIEEAIRLFVHAAGALGRVFLGGVLAGIGATTKAPKWRGVATEGRQVR